MSAPFLEIMKQDPHFTASMVEELQSKINLIKSCSDIELRNSINEWIQSLEDKLDKFCEGCNLIRNFRVNLEWL